MLSEDFELSRGVYLFDKDLYIPTNITLIIKPGAILKFNKGARIISKGKIVAIGTEDSPLIFKGNNNYWRGIKLVSNLSCCKKNEFSSNDNNNTKNIFQEGFPSIIRSGNIFNCCVFQDVREGNRLIMGKNNFKGAIEV